MDLLLLKPITIMASTTDSTTSLSTTAMSVVPAEVKVEVKLSPMDELKIKFDTLTKKMEMKDTDKKILWDVLTTTDVVLVCDDSGSMQDIIAEEGISQQVSKKTSTRWQELRKLAAELIKIVVAGDPRGLDIYFLNRGTYPGVKDMSGMGPIFAATPDDYQRTPLISTMNKIYDDKSGSGRQVLVVIVTDGHPSDGSLHQLKRCFQNKPSNFHISMAECTDERETMRFLDEWDREIDNFDNTEDYREELELVRQTQGQNFKFTYTDYALKILLATFSKKFFNVDQTNLASSYVQSTYAQSSYVQPTYSQSSYVQSSYTQPTYNPPVYPTSTGQSSAPPKQVDACCIVQ